MSNERNRIAFMVARDGPNASRDWALKVLRIYRTAVLQNGQNGLSSHFASNKEFKFSYIRSYLELKQFYFFSSSNSAYSNTVF